jgi:diguanylate cyclase (GGDEF)-like protein/PAS domain S-box-containing protein
VLALYPRQLQATRRALLNKVFDTGVAVTFDDEQDGIFLRSSIFPIGSCVGRPSAVGIMAVDLSRELKRERALTAALERAAVLEDIVNRSPVMAFLWRDEPDYPVEYVSQNVKQLGYSVADLISGKVSWTGITHPEDLARLEAELEEHVRNGDCEWMMKYRLRLADGTWRWMEDLTRPKRDISGKVTHYEALVTDITDKVRCQELLEATSLMDELSGLYNRRAFPALAQQQLALARRNKLGVFMMYCDLDGLKDINDRLGHAMGDQAIRCMSTILKGTARASDVVARLGGDEFVVFGQETGPDGSKALEVRLAAAIKRRNDLGDLPFTLSLSLGRLVLSASQELNLDCMLAEADQLMYQDKRSKGDGR